MRSLIAGPVLAAWSAATVAVSYSGPVFAGATARDVIDEVGQYVTAPLRWDGRDWMYFGGTVVAVAAAYQYDDAVRTHFVGQASGPLPAENRHSMEDFAPAAAVLAGTWLYAMAIDSDDGRHDARSMAEAAVLAASSTYVFKLVAGRERPDVTSDPHRWRVGGDSFPGSHTSVAFAVGAVFAESGGERYRWARRLTGYGIGVGTAYLRLRHNAHWLSDTVAGAALGVGTGYFVMNRHGGGRRDVNLMVVPTDGGAMLTFAVDIR